MEFLYSKLIIHCDLTSVNILLDEDYTAKICDFGWSKEFSEEPKDTTYTRNNPKFKAEW